MPSDCCLLTDEQVASLERAAEQAMEQQQKRRTFDDELKAIDSIIRILEEMEGRSQRRVMVYIADRFAGQ